MLCTIYAIAIQPLTNKSTEPVSCILTIPLDQAVVEAGVLNAEGLVVGRQDTVPPSSAAYSIQKISI